MKRKITIILEDAHFDYLNIFADEHFDGNKSMALRCIITDHTKFHRELK